MLSAQMLLQSESFPCYRVFTNPCCCLCEQITNDEGTAGRVEFKVILHLCCFYVTVYMQANISETQSPTPTTYEYTVSLLPGRFTYTRNSNYLN